MGWCCRGRPRLLDAVVDWGRYAELYDYDSDDEELTLEPGAQDNL